MNEAATPLPRERVARVHLGALEASAGQRRRPRARRVPRVLACALAQVVFSATFPARTGSYRAGDV